MPSIPIHEFAPDYLRLIVVSAAVLAVVLAVLAHTAWMMLDIARRYRDHRRSQAVPARCIGATRFKSSDGSKGDAEPGRRP